MWSRVRQEASRIDSFLGFQLTPLQRQASKLYQRQNRRTSLLIGREQMTKSNRRRPVNFVMRLGRLSSGLGGPLRIVGSVDVGDVEWTVAIQLDDRGTLGEREMMLLGRQIVKAAGRQGVRRGGIHLIAHTQ